MDTGLEKQKKKPLFSRGFIYLLVFLAINLVVIVTTLTVRIFSYGDDFLTAFIFLVNIIYLDQLLRQTAIFLGLITLIGYLALHRPLAQAITGAIKTVIGFLLLSIGTGSLIAIAKPVFIGMRDVFGVNIIPLDPYFGWVSINSFLEFGFGKGNNYLSWATYVFTLAFFLNILLVALKRFTNCRSIMITGHVMFQQATIVTGFVWLLLFSDQPLIAGAVAPLTQLGIVLISAVILAIYWAVATSLTIKPVDDLIGGAGFAVGHQQMLSIFLAYKAGRFFGKAEDSAETKRLPGWLRIFEDNIFTQVVILTILFSILITVQIFTASQDPVLIFKDSGYVFNNNFSAWNVFPKASPPLNILGGSMKLVASILAILTGVRLFIAELQQAFQGVSEKIIPGAVVAVDVAAVFGFYPLSLTIGFVAGTIGQFLGLLVSFLFSLLNPNLVALTIPLFITLFFNSGPLGIFANKTGGWKAAIALPFLVGLVEVLTISFALGQAGGVVANSAINLDPTLSPIAKGFNGMADWNLFFGAFILLASQHKIVAAILVILLVTIPLILIQFVDTSLLKTEPKGGILKRWLAKKTAQPETKKMEVDND